MQINKLLILSAISVMCFCYYGCKNDKAVTENTNDETTLVDDDDEDAAETTISSDSAPVLNDDEQMEELAKLLVTTSRDDLYENNYALLKKYCTKNALKKLHDEYDYESEPGQEVYSVWSFDCGGQDPGDTVIVSLEKIGTNEFKIVVKDAAWGNTTEHLFKFAKVNGTWKLDDYR